MLPFSLILYNIPFFISLDLSFKLSLSLPPLSKTFFLKRGQSVGYTSSDRKRHDFELADSLGGESECYTIAKKHIVRVRL